MEILKRSNSRKTTTESDFISNLAIENFVEKLENNCYMTFLTTDCLIFERINNSLMVHFSEIFQIKMNRIYKKHNFSFFNLKLKKKMRKKLDNLAKEAYKAKKFY